MSNTDPFITGALMVLRDKLKQEAADILTPIENKLKDIKAEYHEAKILSNQKKKAADKVQALISAQMMQDYTNHQQVMEDYQYQPQNNQKVEIIFDTDD